MGKKEDSEEGLREKTRRLSVKEAGFYSIHDGFGLRYITPYALEIGKNNPYTNTYIGLLTSVPSLVSNLSQIWTSRLMEKYSRKTLVKTGVLLQSLMWLGIIFTGICFFLFGMNSNLAMIMLLLFYTLLVWSGAMISPVWTSWMKDIVTKDQGKYFGNRNKVLGIVALATMLIGGLVLDYFKPIQVFIGFAALFFIAFMARGYSGLLFKKYYEPELKLSKGYYFSFKDFVKKLPTSNYAKFSLFVALIMFATSVASPFFSVYMLKNLGFNYTLWISTVVLTLLGQILFVPSWGKFIDKYGPIKAMKISGALIPFIPLVWLFTPLMVNNPYILFPYLFVEEFASGVIWAGFNLSASNFIYSAVTRERVGICSAYYNVLQGFGVFIGATIGGMIASQSFSFLGLNEILFVFMISGILRGIIYFVMISKIKEVNPVQEFDSKKIFKKIVKR